ncbi:hypothetical protein [Veillonella rodentium]|uniref:C4-dicarboxylate transporter n=1 Tax=Veillonella rodentium TaxID=248315 RepID=A0A239Y8K6_9FIRM|nr:hypothetical protein [Veillonella rodentium]SNV55395.1 C4-dicarboxylate transporter [Veillonella rodentium]
MVITGFIIVVATFIAIIIAGLAGINPMELAKRNAVPCVAATVVIMLLLL